MAQLAPSLEWTQSYKDQPHKTGFLDLPREIRDYVYRFAFRVPGAIFIYAPKHHTGLKLSVKAMNYRHRNEGPNEPQPLANAINIALLRTCRQLHAECSPVLYGENVFRVWFLSDAEIMPTYCPLVHHILYSWRADSRIYKHNLDEVQYGWRHKFWPGIVEAGTGMLMRFPALESLTIPISPFKYGQNWTPAFFNVKNKTRQQRIDMAARWMKSRCPFEDERLRACLHLELTPAVPIEVYKDSIFYDRDDDYEVWDVNEFSEAFQMMKDLR